MPMANNLGRFMTYLVLQSHVIKESCDFMGEIPSRSVTTIPCFGGHRHCGSRDMMLLVVEGQDFLFSRLNL